MPGAWIITGGMHAGVMKLIGEAVHGYTIAHGTKRKITVIGVCPWGCVFKKKSLVGKVCHHFMVFTNDHF